MSGWGVCEETALTLWRQGRSRSSDSAPLVMGFRQLIEPRQVRTAEAGKQ